MLTQRGPNEFIITGSYDEKVAMHNAFYNFLTSFLPSFKPIAVYISNDAFTVKPMTMHPDIVEDTHQICSNISKAKCVSNQSFERFDVEDFQGNLTGEDLSCENSLATINVGYICRSIKPISLSIFFRYGVGFYEEEENRLFLEQQQQSTENLIVLSSNHSDLVDIYITEEPISSVEDADVFKLKFKDDISDMDLMEDFKQHLVDMYHSVSS